MAKKVAVAPAATPPQLVTRAEVDNLIRSINTKFASVEKAAATHSFRFESFLKLACQNEVVSYSAYVKGLRQFATFSNKVEELKKVSKLSDRIKQTLSYNDSITGTDEFKILADDVDILQDVVNAEAMSKENYDLCMELETTVLFRELISKFVSKS